MKKYILCLVLMLASALAYCQYNSTEWEEIGPTNPLDKDGKDVGVGRMHAIRFHPDFDGVTNKKIYCGPTNGGVFKTTSDFDAANGPTWENLNTDQLPSLSVGDIAIVGTSPEKIYFATGNPDFNMSKYAKHKGDAEFYSRGIFLSLDDGDTWNNTPIGVWQDLDDLIGTSTPNYINSTVFWAAPSNMQISRLLVHPTNNSIMYVVIVKSRFINHPDPNPDEFYLDSYVYKTNNGGNTWNKKWYSPDGYLRSMEFLPSDPSFIMVAGRKVYRTTNSGEDWTEYTASDLGVGNATTQIGNNEVGRYKVSVNTSGNDPAVPATYTLDNFYIACIKESGDGNIWITKSSNGGLSFPEATVNFPDGKLSTVFGGPYPLSRFSFAVLGENDSETYYAGSLNVRKYSESGTNIILNTHVDIHALERAPNTDYIFIGHDGGISYQSNATLNATTINITDGIGCAQVYDISKFYGTFSDENYDRLSAGMQDIGTIVYDYDQSQTQQEYKHLNYTEGSCLLHPNNPNHLYMGCGYQKALSHMDFNYQNLNDPLPTWGYSSPSNLSIPWMDISGSKFNFPIVPDLNNPIDYDVLVGLNNKFYRHTYNDQSHSTTNLHTDPDEIAYISTVAQAPSDPKTIYIGYGYYDWSPMGSWTKHIQKTENGDAASPTFTPIASGIEHESFGHAKLNDMAVDPYDEDIVIAGFNSYDDCSNDDGVDCSNLGSIAFKVVRSDDGGSTWSNFSGGLPQDAAVISLAYDYTEDGGVFAGTAHGLYYRNNNTPWTKYGHNLPNLAVYDVKVNFEEGRVYVATFGRGIWSAPLPCMETGSTDELISSTVTWDVKKTRNKNIIIEDGAVLTIKADQRFTTNAKIIVKPKGKLIVDGARLTSRCSDFWYGIEVWGNTDENQYPIGNPTHQGYCELKNGATIENAGCGIRNWKHENWSRCGGVIVAEDAQFLNCYHSMYFAPYTNSSPYDPNVKRDDLSTFTNCTFDVNDDYFEIPGKHFMKHVILWDVKGVRFKSCTFKNSQTNKVYATNENSNQAIFALSAGFTVEGSCSSAPLIGYPCPEPDLTRSVFEGFNLAIRLEATSSIANANITQCLFRKNARAIQVEGMNNVVITRNKFEIGDCEITGLPTNDERLYGIKLTNCTGFLVEENELEGTTTYNYPPIGISPQNTNKLALSDNNEVYNNDLIKLYRGLHPTGNNRTSDPWSGLQLLCNDFSQTGVDGREIDVAKDSENPDPSDGIRDYQGNEIGTDLVSAGNSFTINPGQQPKNYWNLTEPSITYYYYEDANDPEQKPESTFGVNLKCTTEVIVNNTPTLVPVSENNCPSNIINGAHFPMDETDVISVYSNFSTGKTAYLNLYYAYLQEIDGGSTPAVLQQIQNTWPQEAWDLRNDLMALAPFVSREALEEAALSGILPDAMLFEICMANPDATRDQEFLDFLANGIPNPLPQYMVDLIQENWDLETARTILERDMASAAYKMDYNMNLLLTNEKLKDEPDIHLLRNYYGQRDNLSDRYWITDSYIEEAKFDSSILVLDQIPIDFTLDDRLLDEYDNYYLYHDLLQSLNDSNRSIFDLDTNQVALLQQIADDNTGIPSIKSRNILCFVYELCEEYPGNPSDTSQHKSTPVSISPEQILNKAYTSLEVSPNPATYFTEFSWEILNLDCKARIEIYDLSGKIMASHCITEPKGKWAFDTRNLVPGTYLYSLTTHDSKLAEGKLTIQK